MKTNVKRKLIICIITLILLAITLTQTYATQTTISDANELINLLSNNTNQLNSAGATNIPEGNVNKNTNTNRNTTTNININANANSNNNTNNRTNNSANKNELPDTGLDTPSIAIVVICVVSAIYAYKKIKDYNNI